MVLLPIEPGPEAITSGMSPAIKAKDVIRIGLNLIEAPAMAACKIVIPCKCFCTANSTINTAFLPNKPISITIAT